jgi:hypothetical protein
MRTIPRRARIVALGTHTIALGAHAIALGARTIAPRRPGLTRTVAATAIGRSAATGFTPRRAVTAAGSIVASSGTAARATPGG